MEIRKLRREELAEASLISLVAFHARTDSIEESRKEIEENFKDIHWGAFSENGAMMARIINNRFPARFDGHVIENGGIGAVSTLPEYRNSGAVRAMMEKILIDARAQGEVVSTLYPFNHAFYRKFGYELSVTHTEYEFPVTALKGFRFGGWAKLWHPGETPELFTEVFNAFGARYNLTFVRDDGMMGNHVRGAYYKDRRFSYLLGDANGACAYIVFEDIAEDGANTIRAADTAFIGRRGLHALLGFLARFDSDYKTVKMRLPEDVNLCALVNNPYDIKKLSHHAYMARIVNAPRALALMKKPEGAAFTIEVRDGLLRENAGVWRVSGDAVEPTDAPADLVVSELALAPMALGYAPLCEAELRGDVEIKGNREALDAVFIKKPTFAADHF
ncbi:MAG: GNAT family N-acetyltransferase [Christensenellales bacterium]|jgi:predicted acetyltransferase